MTVSAWTRDPLLALYLLFIVALPFARPSLPMPGTSLRVQLADVLLAGTYLLWGWRWIRTRPGMRVGRLVLASVIYVAALAVSVLRSPDVMPSGLVKLAAYAPLVFLPSLTASVLASDERLVCAVRAWLLGALLATVVGLVGFLAFYVDRNGLSARMMVGYGAIPPGPYPRLWAPFVSPNMFQNYLTVSMSLLLGCGFFFARRAVTWAIAGAMGFVAFFTLSAGFGGLAIAAAVVALGREPLRRRPWGWRHTLIVMLAALVALACALATVASFVPSGEGHVPIGYRDLRLMDDQRPIIWRVSLDAIRQHPITGLGYSALVARISDPRTCSPGELRHFGAQVRGWDMEAHNVWLNVTGQAGILGLAAFVLLLGALLSRLSVAPLRDHGPLSTLPLALTAAVLGAFAYHGLFESNEETRHLWALFGLVVAVRGRRQAGGRGDQRPVPEALPGC